MKVVHVAFECAPIFKTGGLGDVVGALPKYQKELGIESVVVMPGFGWVTQPSTLPGSTVPVWYVNSPYFAKPNPTHDHKIQAPKYAHFAWETLELLKRREFVPDIINCHDWHTGLIAWLIKKTESPFFAKTKLLLTIHNIGYQGNFPKEYLDKQETKIIYELLPPAQKRVAFLKLGIESADYISTVSPNHAAEIRTKKVGFGLGSLIRGKRGKFIGIINGLDYTVWNPHTDPYLFAKFNSRSVDSGKSTNKAALQKELGLKVDPAVPLYGFVARLSWQKGIDLLAPLLPEFIKRRWQLVILGTGDKKYESLLRRFQKKMHKPWLSINFLFDEKMAHTIYGSSDAFIIPSHYEPCGLTQMISMAYGTIPVAAKVGGLKDAISHNKTGILFDQMSPKGLLDALSNAEEIIINTKELSQMRKQMLRQDFSWQKSAREYIKLYRKMLA